MFVREKTINGYTYLYLVENVREGGRTKQHIIRNLGRKDAVLAASDLDRLMASIGRFSERAMVLSAIDTNPAEVQARRIGGPLLFGRLWKRLGIGEVLESLLEGRQFGFAVERAVFVATLHRLFVSGSDRACVDWMCEEKGIKPEWQPLLNDLDRLQQATIEKDGKAITVRTPTTGMVGSVFQAAGIALP